MTIQGIIITLSDLVNVAIPVLISLALALFLWGATKYVLAGDSVEGRSKGRGLMIYGIIALFVIVSVWGLVNVLANTFQVGFTTAADAMPGQIVPTR